MSFVLNRRVDAGIPPDTWRRVEEAARDLGYHPHGAGQALAGGSSGTIGFVVRQSAEQVAADALLPEVLWGLSAEAHAAGYRVLVETLSTDNRHYRELVAAARVDGIVISGPRDDDGEIDSLADAGFPMVLLGSRSGRPVASVDIDNRAAARHAVMHLIAQGHRRIACITNAPRAYTASAERLSGWRAALGEAGVSPRDQLIEEGEFDAGSGYAAMLRLLDREPGLTACFAASDVVAIGALRALREAGRAVPDDVSVVGFDDIALAQHIDPPLTTVRVPARALGAAAGRDLIAQLTGRASDGRMLLDTELVVRESASPPSRRRGARRAQGGSGSPARQHPP